MTLMSMDSVIRRDLQGCLMMTTSEVGGRSEDKPEGGCSTVTEKERCCNAKAFRDELLRLTTPELVAVKIIQTLESSDYLESYRIRIPSEVGLTVRIMG